MPKGLGEACLRVIVSLVWCAAFAWLLVSGERTRYLGPRTAWVVPLGFACLSAVTVGQLVALRRSRSQAPLSARSVASALLVLSPLLAVIAVPSPRLGALAAARKAPGAEAPLAEAFRPEARPGQISFIDFRYASESEDYAAELGISDGSPLELTGFVTRPEGLPSNSFALTRFYISCCAADAVPYSVTILVPDDVTPAAPAEDTWLEVRGSIVKDDRGYEMEAGSITEVPPPDDPYL